MKLIYRPEIDGLRGLAIFIIFLSHFPHSIVKSGGVNIFFVMSGFLIAQIVDQKYKHNLIGFYKSRIQSLYPQLLIISVVIYISFLLFGEFEYIKRFYDSCKFAVMGILNIFFIREGVTYGQESFLNPFGPFWAFSIIIQYYITYGLIYKFIIKKEEGKLSALSKVSLITVLSIFTYGLAFAISPNSDYVNFYSLLTRYWQFLAGASLYYFLLKNTISVKAKNILILVALFALLGWQYLEVLNVNFQVKTLLISLIALCVIAASGSNNFINKILSTRLMTQFGKISYPFYLWHMIFIYFAYLYLIEVNNFYKALITLLVIILSVFSIRLNSYLVKKKHITSALLIGVILLSSIMQIFNKDISNYFKTINYQENLLNKFNDSHPNLKATQEALKDNKGLPCNTLNLKLDCNFNRDANNKVILLGTSHMAIFTKTLSDKLTTQGFNVHAITRGGCPFLPNFYRTDRKHCTKESINNLNSFLLSSKKSTIVISQRFPLHLSTEYYTNSKGFSESKKGLKLFNDENKSIFDGFHEALKSLTDYGHKLILVYPIPEFGEHIPTYYKKGFGKLDLKDLNEPRAFYDERTKESFLLLDSLKSKNIERVYPSDVLCDGEYCFSMINNKILYSDDDHLNQNGVDLVVPEIISKIKKLSIPTSKPTNK